MEPTRGLRLVAYLRVSSNAQATADTIDHQRRAVRAWAKVQGHRLVKLCEDEAVSGTKDVEARPGLAGVVDALRDGQADAVVMKSLDRLARSLTVQEAALAILWGTGTRVFTLDSGE